MNWKAWNNILTLKSSLYNLIKLLIQKSDIIIYFCISHIIASIENVTKIENACKILALHFSMEVLLALIIWNMHRYKITSMQLWHSMLLENSKSWTRKFRNHKFIRTQLEESCINLWSHLQSLSPTYISNNRQREI